jgi:hypothetical protein
MADEKKNGARLDSGLDPADTWEVKLSCEPESKRVKVAVEQAPASAEITELSEVLTLGALVFQPLEDKHLLGHRERPQVRGTARAHRSLRWTMAAAMGIAVLALGVKAWTQAKTHAPLTQGLQWLSDGAPNKAAIAYPLPAKPFPTQATVPCVPTLDEVEINGGCWMELARRAPCNEKNQAEHKGKCYMPVSKDRMVRPPPTSVGP